MGYKVLMIELKLITDFPHEIIALDEVGRSPLCGPVVISGVKVVVHNLAQLERLVKTLRRKGVRDSKLLNHRKRELVLEKLKIPAIGFRQLGEVSLCGAILQFVTWEMHHEVIERENIFQASMRGMKEAALALYSGADNGVTLLLDGQSRLRWEGAAPSWCEIPIVKGDMKSPLIGLASIIAKEKRDDFMRDMDELFPQYGLKHNVGYPTLLHRKAIQKYGPCPIHRKTFGKVKEFLKAK